MMRDATPAAFASPRRLRRALLLLFLATLSCCFHDLRSDAQGTLPPQETDALKKIAEKLNIAKAVWNFDEYPNPCSGSGGWQHNTTEKIVSYLVCDCGANTTTTNTTDACHVIKILLKGQNLTGVLPEDFGDLTSLIEIDLSRNCINGTIPAAAWASLPLWKLALGGNRISGTIPKEMGNIRTLQDLELDNNMLRGPIPGDLGNLTNLITLNLSANNFTGELPDTLGNLTYLQDFRIDGNDISGKIPYFTGNWTKLYKLYMQGTSLEGPFPSTFCNLQRLTELRVTGLKNTDGSFPRLKNMPNMTDLVLRNCSISGEIPENIGEMTLLKTLDLSFNNLTGQIPPNFRKLINLKHMYLTNNMLTGSIPSWITSNNNSSLDVSYNTFNGTESVLSDCRQPENTNYIASFSPIQSNRVVSCLKKDQPCSGKAKNYQLFINCGGKKLKINDTEYEEDSSTQGTSTYFLSDGGNWAYSSTGDFVGDSHAKYIAESTTILTMPNAELYMSARLNPLSLKYYGLCMRKGNYTVKLHFAEIIFADADTCLGVGRRVFDVSIQGRKVLRDFNIAEEAGGFGKELIKNFNASVEGSTLEIHFQWAGKGTNGVPKRGVYGSLISAISITPNFRPDLGKKFPIGAIVGIVAASCVLAMLILMFLWFCLRRKGIENNELRGLELQTGYFSLNQIKAATGNFDTVNKIGEGGFGPVYKGVLPDGSTIAVKQLSSKSKQGNREFVNEIGMISALQHPNLVKLYGCCIERNQLLLIYEYMENNSLARALFGPEGVKLKLDWQTRHKICLGIARGLAYIHEESRLKIVHRDIKATNILLDKDMNAKISDFGLAKLDEEENTHISTRIAGTMGYMAPEYALRGCLTDKADVYSFGVVVLETVSGKSNANYRTKEDLLYLLDWAYVLQEQGNLLDLVDPSLGTNYSKEEAQQMLDLALVCTSTSPTLRPPMSSVVSMLEGRTPVRVPSVKHVEQVSEEMRSKSLEKISHDSQKQSISMDAPLIDSSTSILSSKEFSPGRPSTSKLLSDDTEQHQGFIMYDES